MKADIVNINGTEFLKLRVIPIKQKDKVFYVGNMPASFLLQVYTVEPVEYDVDKAASLAETFRDDKDYAEFRLDMDRKESEIDTKSFERKLDKSRVKEIAEFLNTDEYALFPNSIIVMCDLINDSVDIPTNADILDITDLIVGKENLAFLHEPLDQSKETELYIPKNKNAVLVIDGQHRLKGLESVSSELIDNYDVLVSFIVGFDRAVIAKLFTTINYTQRPVNKSLLYHLSGEFSHKLNNVTFLHEVVRVLNEVAISPLYKRIKMLGMIDADTTQKVRENMTISQAFLIDYLIRTIDTDAKTGLYPPIFLPYYKEEEMQVEIIRFLMNYFSAVRKIKQEDWDNPSQSILCKTIGIGAFIRVMYFLFVKMVVKQFSCDYTMIKTVTVDDLASKLSGVKDINFRVDGPYGKTASGGSLNKLKEEIIIKMGYFDVLDYDQFLDEYRSKYINPFRDLLNE